MSLLAPLYALGALAIALPILFHLIRRQVKKRTPISSTMFLPEMRPPLRNRSRVENLPLLLLRALALLLLAFAFSRPFMRSAASESSEGLSRRTIVLVDTSASMRRGDLWTQAIAELRSVTAGLNPGDSLAVIAFDARPDLRLDFETAQTLPIETLRAIGDSLFADQLPTWNGTDLGAALRAAAELAVENEGVPVSASEGADDSEPSSVAGSTQVVLISDLQSGARRESLQGFAWPREVPVEVRRVTARGQTNAWISLPRVAATDPATGPIEGEQGLEGAQPVFRIRVTNSESSDKAQFRLAWLQVDGSPTADPPREVQVPPGQSLAVRLPPPPADAVAIRLTGDDQDFDNVRYFATRSPSPQKVLYLGPKLPEPRDSPFHYLRQLTLDTATRRVTFAHHQTGVGSTAESSAGLPTADAADPRGDAKAAALPVSAGPLGVVDPRSVPLIVASGDLDADTLGSLEGYVRAGGRLAYLPAPANNGDGSGERALRALLQEDSVSVAEASVRDYAIWTRIDFAHPLFAPLAGPEYNDFSRIRFWAHRTITGLPDGSRVLVAFDDGSPALVERTEGQGRVWVFAAGWQPLESQLGLSTKFVPLMFGLLDADRPEDGVADRSVVGERLSTANLPAEPAAIRVDRVTSPAAPLGRLSDIEEVDRPGVYRLSGDGIETSVAVNLDESESRTEPLETDELERLGIVIGGAAKRAAEEQSERQLRDVELESQQTLWRWFLIGVLGLLAAETFVGGWIARSRVASSGLSPT